MSMNIILMESKDEENKVKKTPAPLLTITGAFRQDSSIINPSIMVEGDMLPYVKANYMHIPDFKRYYFIKDITALRDKLYRIDAHVDVLMSYADAILANTAIIKRQENLWNLYLDDGSFTVYQNPHIVTKEFPNGFTTQEFILAVAGS